ncbi:MAG: type II toxin-antitoxin system RelE/ParE family toxin [Vicinamibacterales bacterium]
MVSSRDCRSRRDSDLHRHRFAPAWADLTVRRIVAAVERLQQFPDSGRVVPERRSPELREVISGNFRMVYRRRATTVEIATVFRGSARFLRHGVVIAA